MLCSEGLVALEQVSPHTSQELSAMGLFSSPRLDLTHELDKSLGMDPPISFVLTSPTV